MEKKEIPKDNKIEEYVPTESQEEYTNNSTLNSTPTKVGRQRRPPKYLTENFYVGEVKLNKIESSPNKRKSEKKNTPKKKKKEEEKIETKSGIIWEFEDETFHPYDSEASDLVEEAYQQWKINPGDFDVRSVKSGQFHYQVDFRQMLQMNVDHENHTTRRIRRKENK